VTKEFPGVLRRPSSLNEKNQYVVPNRWNDISFYPGRRSSPMALMYTGKTAIDMAMKAQG
jgi:hypothetical protein